ncbi:MAG TPA: nitrogenase iron-molybdenum cofactor biosynthesis protein NifN, partial [Chromatiaceae bacterium]|nr:nitrogenase iron-molybdenum cofactor biosynthesis protein NifN [Chromatiaceae bacterium]
MTPAPPAILKRAKALSVSPLKASATLGAALAFLGFRRAIPLLHGSQGCTAFGKVFFVRHFREPIPLQTTAIEQVSAIMGSEDNLVEGLRVICEKHDPDLIGVPTTGLVETQGCDIRMAVKNFRSQYPQYARIAVVPVATPDFTGSLESGYALATQAIIEWLVPSQEATGTQAGQLASPTPLPHGERGQQPLQVNVLAGSHLTPGDLEHLKALIEAFGLQPLVLPDLSDSLDGHLPEEDFSPLTLGGASVAALATLQDAAATLVIGGSMHPAADLLQARTGVPDYRLPPLMGLEAVDSLVRILAKIAARP